LLSTREKANARTFGSFLFGLTNQAIKAGALLRTQLWISSLWHRNSPNLPPVFTHHPREGFGSWIRGIRKCFYIPHPSASSSSFPPSRLNLNDASLLSFFSRFPSPSSLAIAQKICLTDYRNHHHTILVALVHLTGATFSKVLTDRCTHLLCPPTDASEPATG